MAMRCPSLFFETMKKVKIESNNQANTGMSEEEWHRFWYDQYQLGVVGIIPPSPYAMLHYNLIPEELKAKFRTDNYNASLSLAHNSSQSPIARE